MSFDSSVDTGAGRLYCDYIMENSVETVPVSKLPYLRARFETLAKRAKRLRVPAPELTVLRTRLEPTGEYLERADGARVERMREVADVRVDGTRPTATIAGEAGWEPVANLVHTPAGNVVRAREGYKLPTEYRTRQLCDHCGTKRARKDTWIFRHTITGRLVQVGRNCTQDYTGGELSASQLALWSEAWGCAGEEGTGSWGPSPREFLYWVAAVIRVDGYFLGATKAREQGRASTAEVAFRVMGRWAAAPNEARAEGLPYPNGDDVQVTADALAWLEAAEEDSDYLTSVRAACSLFAVDGKTQGYVASLVGAAYPRAMGRAARQRAATEAAAASGHVGKLGARQQFEALKIERVRHWEGHYGPTTLVVFSDRSGNVLQWYASGERVIKEGDTVNVRAAVKKHTTDRYTGGNVTVLSRVTFIG